MSTSFERTVRAFGTQAARTGDVAYQLCTVRPLIILNERRPQSRCDGKLHRHAKLIAGCIIELPIVPDLSGSSRGMGLRRRPMFPDSCGIAQEFTVTHRILIKFYTTLEAANTCRMSAVSATVYFQL